MKEFELEPGETVVRETRKHWLLFVIGLIPYLILGVLPTVLPTLLKLSEQMSQYAALYSPTASELFRTALGVWLLLVWTAAWSAFTRYYLNVWVLTTERIVTIKQRGYFRREVSSLLLTRVQDVTTTVTGVLPSLIGIGDIKVQTAGEDIEFVMAGIPDPEEMRDLILKNVPEGPKNTGI